MSARFGFPSDLLGPLTLLIGALGTVALAFALAAVAMRVHGRRALRRRLRFERRFEPRILEVLLGERDAESLAREIPARDAHLWLDLLLRYARRVRGDDSVRLALLAAPHLDGELRRRMRRGAEHRALAVEMMSALGRTRLEPEITRALDDPAPLVAMIAARALTRISGPGCLGPLLDRMDRFHSWTPRLLASMLASIGPGAAPALRRALADPRRPAAVRTICAEALAQLHDLRAATPAADVVTGENDRELVAACLRLLTKVGRPEHAGAVRQCAAASDFVLRAHALTTLAKLGEPDDAGRLRAALDDPSPWVALHAATGLRETGRLTELRELAASDRPRAELARQVLSEASH